MESFAEPGESGGAHSRTLNPWDGRGSVLGINLGDPARVLTVARRHGLLSQDTSQVTEFCYPPPPPPPMMNL